MLHGDVVNAKQAACGLATDIESVAEQQAVGVLMMSWRSHRFYSKQ